MSLLVSGGEGGNPVVREGISGGEGGNGSGGEGGNATVVREGMVQW